MKNKITLIAFLLFITFAYEVNAQALAVTQHAITSVTGKTFTNTPSKTNVNTNYGSFPFNNDANKVIKIMLVEPVNTIDKYGVFERPVEYKQPNYLKINYNNYNNNFNPKQFNYVYPNYKVVKY